MTKVSYRVFAMNFLACLINYGDRIAMSVAAPFILRIESGTFDLTW
jgi:ACS family hexuronate transporter-like MFS transporter